MNVFGTLLKVSIYGESHGSAVGVILDGCPPGVPVLLEDFTEDMERRRGGKPGTTLRVEEDEPNILSGVFNGCTTGSPIHLMLKNRNVRSRDYQQVRTTPRPGREDWAASQKFNGYEDFRGGGHFSGRLTAGLVAAGVIAKKLLAPVEIFAYLKDEEATRALAVDVGKDGDSIGGVVECVVTGCDVGWGEPFFDSVESLLAHAAFSIPGVKGIEFGAGFHAATLKGSEYNDPILDVSGHTSSNHAGGIVGGLTNGNDLVFRIALRPTGSISKPQNTVNRETGEQQTVTFGGRHDACFALRVPVVLEAVTALVLADLNLRNGLLRQEK